ncbi:MAG: Tat pathway signal protein, partial [Asticcacaulis sp.]|nr:Tat pathway signal protein [Asticcacaulis sp.]
MNRRRILVCFALFTAASAMPALASEPKKKGGGPGYTQFPMLNVFTAAQGGRHGNLSLDMGLYAKDSKMVDRIKLYMPRLKDAYISRLQAYAANLTPSSMVDADYLSVQLQAATDT